MAQQIEISRLLLAWRALAGNDVGLGWRTIPIEIKGNCRILAGRFFPGDEEAILVGFSSASVPHDENLPQGSGFHVNRIARNIIEDGNIWISLARLPAGNLDMFSLMAEDVVKFLSMRALESEASLLQALLGRIKAWQNFMNQGSSGVLSAEAEIGLYGELVVLQKLLESLSPIEVVNTWKGPLRGTHDFLIGTGGIEVKTTLVKGTFPAKISSLEQLDSSLVTPLFLAAVRLELKEAGKTLPAFARDLRDRLSDDSVAVAIYENQLIQAGFLECQVERYLRKFNYVNTYVFLVDSNFPKLTKGNVSLEIRKAVYEIDLTLVNNTDVGIDSAITVLRGI